MFGLGRFCPILICFEVIGNSYSIAAIFGLSEMPVTLCALVVFQ
jgi:hypothetical protein